MKCKALRLRLKRGEAEQKAVEILTRTRSARAFQPQLCFFAVTSVTRRGNSEGKVEKIRWGVQQKGRRNIAFFKGATLGF